MFHFVSNFVVLSPPALPLNLQKSKQSAVAVKGLQIDQQKVSFLKTGGWIHFHDVQGQYGSFVQPYLILNMTLDDIQTVSAFWNQDRFLYCTPRPTGILCQYYVIVPGQMGHRKLVEKNHQFLKEHFAVPVGSKKSAYASNNVDSQNRRKKDTFSLNNQTLEYIHNYSKLLLQNLSAEQARDYQRLLGESLDSNWTGRHQYCTRFEMKRYLSNLK